MVNHVNYDRTIDFEKLIVNLNKNHGNYRRKKSIEIEVFCTQGKNSWDYISKGISARENSSFDSTLKFELSLSLVKNDNLITTEPYWPSDLLKKVAKSILEGNLRLKDGDILDLEEYEGINGIFGFIAINNPYVSKDNLAGKGLDIIHLIGITRDEFDLANKYGSNELLRRVVKSNPKLLTIEQRASYINQDSPTNPQDDLYLSQLEFAFLSEGMFELSLSIDDATRVGKSIFERLENMEEVDLIGDELVVSISKGDSFEIEERRNGDINLKIPNRAISYLKKLNYNSVQVIKVPDIKLIINITKSYFRNNFGEIIGILDRIN